jgi:hypothetical protein
MLGHSIVHGGAAATGLLPPLPLATAAPTVVRIAGLSPAAAAFHAAAGTAYEYAGTLVIASRSPAVDGVPTGTAVHFVEAAVVQHDAGGLLVALGSALPAERLTVRCDPEIAPPDGSRLRELAYVVECRPPSLLEQPSTDEPITDVQVRFATTADECAVAMRELPGSMPVSIPPSASTLVARLGPDSVGFLTWRICSDPLDRRRRADVVAHAIVDDDRADDVVAALFTGMQQYVARVPDMTLRAALSGASAEAERDTLLRLGWTPAFTLRGMDPWMRT